ncbi:MAG: monovalent cation/hydrogen antiporter [Solirubrobacteraceae bacterium]|nr:monovalent cation/hydrogen antiporter [Solirubrobacteraceae bacterium]
MPIAAGSSELDLVLLGVMLAAVLFLVGAYHTRVPYPILLVLGGAALGFVPGLPDVRLAPDLVLVLVLPPLLYAAAFFSSLRDLRDNLRPISLLSIGLVVATTVAVAAVAHAVVDGLSWEAAFVLGAVVSPTDPVAASAIASRLGAPRRYVTIVEGESLVNDATALVAYKVAVAAALSGGFSLFEAGGRFVLNAAVGIAIGLAVGYVIARLRRAVDDAPTEITISLVTPYFAYLPAEALGVSAVLAAVTSGIYLGWRAPQLVTPDTRMRAFAVWEVLIFVLNAGLFMLVGLQLPAVLHGIGGLSVGAVALDAVAVCAAVILVRFAWVFPATYLPRVLWRRVREADPAPGWREPTIVAWTGMRGAVSLAAALAIPEAIDHGSALPQRDLIVFLTYAVIMATLVLQGLTLPRLISRLGLDEHGSEEQREATARLLAARAAIQRLDQLAREPWVREDTLERLRRSYEYRVRRFAARFDDGDDGAIERRSVDFQRLRRELLEAEREAIIQLRNRGRIDDQIMHRIERDLDLEDSRLEL